MFRCILCAVWFTIILTETFSKPVKIEDGVLVTKNEDVRTVSVQSEVIITIQQPDWPDELLKTISSLRHRVNNILTFRTMHLEDRQNWLQRLDDMINVINNNVTVTSVNQRRKRSLFGFVGHFSKSLFGTATEEDVQRIAKVLQRSASSQFKIIHRVNDLLTIVNHSNAEIQVNRDRLNLLTNSTKNIISAVDSVTNAANRISNEEKSIKMNIMFDNAISSLERCVEKVMEQRTLYQRQKLQLEAQRFTHDLLNPIELKHVLNRFSGENAVIISPLNWYYTYCAAEPIWTGQDLVYRVLLPLVRKDSIVKYNVHTFPVLKNDSHVTTQLNAVKEVAVDSMTGWVLRPYGCVGRKPEVCKSNIAVPSDKSCELSVIFGRKSGYQYCAVTMASGVNYDQIIELFSGQYIILSSGRDMDVRCRRRVPRQKFIPKGVYLLRVEPNCFYETDKWTLKPIRQVSEKVSMTFRHVTVPRVNVRAIVRGHLEKFELSLNGVGDLAKVKTIALRPLQRDNFNVFDMIDNDISVFDILFLILILIIYVYLGFVLYQKYKAKLYCKNKGKSVDKDNEICLQDIQNESKTSALNQTVYGEMHLPRLYPNIPVLHSASVPENECGGHRLNEGVKDE